MSRPPRVISKTGMYHIIFRGINRQDIFEEAKDYKKLLDIIKKVKEEMQFELYAYCLMSNHVHLFLKEKESGDIKKIMHKVLTTYVGWFNFKYERSGSLIGNRYKSEPIEDDEYYNALIRYIHQNPLKAKIVAELSEYKWSSYVDYLSNRESEIVDKDFLLKVLDKDNARAIKSFEELHQKSEEQNFEISESIKQTDDQIRRKMQSVLKIKDLTTIVSIGKEERNEKIMMLRDAGFSVREIERLTGVSRGIIQRVR